MGKITVEVKINTFGTMKHPNNLPFFQKIMGLEIIHGMIRGAMELR